MAYTLRMGVPEMEAYWEGLIARRRECGLNAAEAKVFKKLVKTLGHLQENPRHNSLSSHEISDLTRKFGQKVFQSYLENHTPAAGRIFWTYGPGKGEITVLAIEPHPEDQKQGAYARVRLSGMPGGLEHG